MKWKKEREKRKARGNGRCEKTEVGTRKVEHGRERKQRNKRKRKTKHK